ncbi:MAG: dihydrodipicolinate reductase, partial [Candidatus Bathyarchaeia archaeon]
MVKSLRIVNFGLGPIGCSIARLLLEKRGVNIVGAIDIDRNRVGKDLGDVIGANRKLGVKVSDDAAKTLKKTKPDVVVHCTSSYLKVILPQLRQIMAAGADVVSTAEELMYPFYTNPTIARQIDRLAKKNKVTVLGTGINPGFVMDTLAVAMTAVTQRVEAIEATR